MMPILWAWKSIHSLTEMLEKGENVNITVDSMQDADWPAIALIFREGIATGDARFENTVPSWEEFDRAHLDTCRLLARSGDEVLAWFVLGAVSPRQVYAGVAEVSIYVKASARGQGIGRTLLEAGIEASEQAGIWMLQAGIFPENAASLALHQQCGFRTVGIRERMGQMSGRWRDVVLVERRSKVVGV
jgi:L-amino acid N-acyltransferase YncA